MYAGVGQPIPIRTTAAHIPQQGLVALPPKVPASARGTAYRPAAPLTTPVGESPYAARFRNAPRVRRALARERREAERGMAGFQAAEEDAFAALVAEANASQDTVDIQRAAFTAAGSPITETRAVNLLLAQHTAETVGNQRAAADLAARGGLVPMLDGNGNVIMVDASTDPYAAAALAAAKNGNPVAVKVGNPLAEAAMALTPAQARAAQVFGQAGPQPQTVLLAQAAKAGGAIKWPVVALVAAGLYLLMRR